MGIPGFEPGGRSSYCGAGEGGRHDLLDVGDARSWHGAQADAVEAGPRRLRARGVGELRERGGGAFPLRAHDLALHERPDEAAALPRGARRGDGQLEEAHLHVAFADIDGDLEPRRLPGALHRELRAWGARKRSPPTPVRSSATGSPRRPPCATRSR